jgi:long-subunit fatty acid transport protein
MLVVAFSTPALAWATNGYFSNGYGIASQSIAGVGIALPQDALAAAANPAGIAFVGNRFDGDISLFVPTRSAEVTGNGYGVDGHYDGNNRSIFALPEFGVTYQILPNTYAGLALYANGGLDTGYASNPYKAFGGRGSAGVDLEQVFLSPTIAYKIADKHAFGIGLNIAYRNHPGDTAVVEAQGLYRAQPVPQSSCRLPVRVMVRFSGALKENDAAVKRRIVSLSAAIENEWDCRQGGRESGRGHGKHQTHGIIENGNPRWMSAKRLR